MSEQQPLYRPEVINAQSGDWLGKVVLTAPPSTKAFGFLALGVIVGLLAILIFGTFTSKVRVNGWLVPLGGMSRVFAPISGIVTRLDVHEGQWVEAGETLLTLSTELRSATLGATQAEIGRLLESRRASLQAEIDQQKALVKQQVESFARREAAMQSEIEQLEQEAGVQASRVNLARNAAQRLATLEQQGFVSLAQVQQQQELALEQAGRVAAIRREQAERRRELTALQAERRELPLRAEANLSALSRSITQIDQDQALTESRREIVLTAPQAGTVAGLQVELGAAADPTAPLLTILPANAALEAHLFGPSRAVGFVSEGDAVKIRYAAYPYQKFGHHTGTISSVSRTGISPVDLPRQLSGLSDLFGGTEPIYRIRVELVRQSVTAYGNEHRLQPGMRLDADVLLEQRRLYEWVLDPLYSLTGRL